MGVPDWIGIISIIALGGSKGNLNQEKKFAKIREFAQGHASR